MLQQRYDRTIEEKWQKQWETDKIYQFDSKDSKKEIYSIDTPPPFTSGELHMGHVLSYSFFDFAARYKRMQGFNVYYPQGWDCQGFPTEVKVEKKYGRLPAPQFREKCVEWTKEMIARMKAQMNDMGFSPDWDYEYRTMEPEYHRKVQLSLIMMYKDKLVYRDKYPVYWCPRCVSAVAKAELDDETKNGTLNHIKFTGPENEELIIATTRPEMLVACEAVLFNPEDERYTALKGKKVKTPLGKEVPVFADKEVDKEFGSGLVMVCTFGDKMDVVWMHRHKLPLYEAIDQYGKMKNAGELNGLKVEDARKKIIEMLEAKGKIVKKEQLNQTYKVHDRCKRPVELLPSLQWFADIRTTAKAIKEMAHNIKWIPDFGISYLIDWVEGAEWDWVISRQRAFGTPLPFYYCECGKTVPADESELPFYAEKAKPKKCECGKEMIPETSVCDCWVDSSITPLIISGWPDDKEKMAKLYPATLRPQGVEIVRTWAFYTIYRSGVALTKTPPFKEILLNGNVLAPDGKKMSKSIGNIISPTELLKEYPTDAIRQWAAMSGAMAKDRPFSYEDIKYAKSFLTKLWNATRFIEGLGNADNEQQPKQLATIDKWILGRMNATIKECTEHMDRYEYQSLITKVQQFFWHDFCDNYLEYVKHRTYADKEGKSHLTKSAALWTLNTVLLNTIKLLAPITPHISEEIYNELFAGKASKTDDITSITKQEWPKPGSEYNDDVEKVVILSNIIKEIRQHKA
ncbi:valine--tRNA ligase, partial [Candidatus Micrarchaeota archaeon]|nr:valine--tRNA ligase [Candidatus Micrarchaeota archaeon]MBU1165339.1 valine--tRNA ligase [Candidatus Micrarchaeota archaeon]MBU1886989.1 valine--tRNA ligase [Candidatus Micrarchaeota archaeon]